MLSEQAYAYPMRKPLRRNKKFAAVVTRICAGRSNRAFGEDAGVNATTIGEMKTLGTVPSYRLLERFAGNLKLSPEVRRELFAAARYLEAPPMNDDFNPHEYLIGQFNALAAHYGGSITVQWEPGQMPADTKERIDQFVREAERAFRADHPEAQKKAPLFLTES